tara:strand:+ start:669 stop:1748 length:1080 start_codon:yes stop_codon:yes gene_type:complete
MFWKEMHVQIDTRLQRINSEVFDVFFPMEKDILLNYAMHKFIRTTLPPNEGNRKQEGHQVTNKRYDDLQTLVTKKTVPTFILEDNVLYSILPYDFFDFITANSKLVYDCNGLDLTKGSAGLYIAYLPFNDETSITNVYQDFKWTIEYTDATPDLILAQKSDYPKFPVMGTNDSKFLIHNFAIYETNRKETDVKVYWEKYGDIYRPNNFIFVSSRDNLDRVTMVITGALTTFASFTLQPHEQYTALVGNNLKKETRLIDSQFVTAFIANPYQTTKEDSPITELTDNRILLHHQSTFASTDIEIVYYRNPKPINSFLDVSCEIHESRHDKIVDIAVDAASAFIGNPRDVKQLTQFINKSHE